MTTEHPDSNTNQPSMFAEQVAPLLPDLLYPSESDEPIELIETYLRGERPLNEIDVEKWLMLPPRVHTEEIPEADFWAPVTTIEDWFGDEERTQAERFQKLKETLERTLTGRQVFRVGDTEIDVYLFGLPGPDQPRVGLKTRVVET